MNSAITFLQILPRRQRDTGTPVYLIIVGGIPSDCYTIDPIGFLAASPTDYAPAQSCETYREGLHYHTRFA